MTEQSAEHAQLRAEGPPAASEDIHLPGSSYLPIAVAAGITLALVGILVSVIIFALGMVIWIVATVIWVRDVRGEIAELPLDRG